MSSSWVAAEFNPHREHSGFTTCVIPSKWLHRDKDGKMFAYFPPESAHETEVHNAKIHAKDAATDWDKLELNWVSEEFSKRSIAENILSQCGSNSDTEIEATWTEQMKKFKESEESGKRITKRPRRYEDKNYSDDSEGEVELQNLTDPPQKMKSNKNKENAGQDKLKKSSFVSPPKKAYLQQLSQNNVLTSATQKTNENSKTLKDNVTQQVSINSKNKEFNAVKQPASTIEKNNKTDAAITINSSSTAASTSKHQTNDPANAENNNVVDVPIISQKTLQTKNNSSTVQNNVGATASKNKSKIDPKSNNNKNGSSGSSLTLNRSNNATTNHTADIARASSTNVAKNKNSTLSVYNSSDQEGSNQSAQSVTSDSARYSITNKDVPDHLDPAMFESDPDIQLILSSDEDLSTNKAIHLAMFRRIIQIDENQKLILQNQQAMAESQNEFKAETRIQMQEMKEMIQTLASKNSDQISTEEKDGFTAEEREDFLTHFFNPKINTVEKLKNLNDTVKADVKYRKMLTEYLTDNAGSLRPMEGGTPNRCVNEMLSAVLTNELAVKYNMDGVQGPKLSIKKECPKILSALRDAMKVKCQAANVEFDVRTFLLAVREWFRLAKNRTTAFKASRNVKARQIRAAAKKATAAAAKNSTAKATDGAESENEPDFEDEGSAIEDSDPENPLSNAILGD